MGGAGRVRSHGRGAGARPRIRAGNDPWKRLLHWHAAGSGGRVQLLVVLPDTNVKGAWHLAEALRDDLSALRVASEGTPVSITISVGVASVEPDDRSAKALLHRADQALYSAKAAGRNCVRASHAPEPPVSGLDSSAAFFGTTH